MLSTRLLARSAARQPRVLFASAGAAPSLRAPASRLFATSALRCAVDEVSKNPASKDLKHMGQNAAEEARGASPSQPHLGSSPAQFLTRVECCHTGIARTLADAVAGQAVEQSSQRTGRENFGAGDIAADLVRLCSPSLRSACLHSPTVPP